MRALPSRRAGVPRVVGTALVVGILTVSSAATAQDAPPTGELLDGHGFVPAPIDGDVRDPLAVHRVGGWSPQQYFVSGLFEYADAPLVWCAQPVGEDVCALKEPLLDDVLALNLSGGYAATERLRVYAAAPVFLSTAEGRYAGGGGGLGDLRLGVQLAGFRDGPVQVGLVPWVDLPTGRESRFLGDPTASGGAALAGSVEVGPLTVSADAGIERTPANAFRPLGTDSVLGGLALGVSPADGWGLTAETRTAPQLRSTAPAGTGAPSELTYTARHRRDTGLHVQLGASHALTSGPGAARFRVFLGLGYQSTSTSDIDGDGILHDDDACPHDAEWFNDWQDVDGCPEEPVFFSIAATVDGRPVIPDDIVVLDGVPTADPITYVASPGHTVSVDAVYGGCFGGTTEAEILPTTELVEVELQPRKGLIRLRVTDASGAVVPTASVQWLLDDQHPRCHPEGRSTVGPDGRLTTVVGASRQSFVVSAPGYGPQVVSTTVGRRSTAVVDVVLGPAHTRITPHHVALDHGILFHYGTDRFYSDSVPLVDEVAAVLLAHPELERVRVVGHTDTQGDDAFNLDLSQRRSEQVIARLVALGVSPDRLTSEGRGAREPVATNRTSKGRAQNRRVEFLIDARSSD